MWSSSLTQHDRDSLERTQKVALIIIYQNDYISYQNALQLSGLHSMHDRYKALLYKCQMLSNVSRIQKTQDVIPMNKACD